MKIVLGILKTQSGNLQIVDSNDEEAPLITLHNEYNNLQTANKIMWLMSGTLGAELEKAVENVKKALLS